MNIECNNCGWSQDDFYSVEGYNPAKYLETWNKQLCGSEAHKLDDVFQGDPDEPVRTHRDIIVSNYEHFASTIKNMKWTTYELFQKDPVKECPKCGTKNDWNID